jgi:hypothetical protein
MTESYIPALHRPRVGGSNVGVADSVQSLLPPGQARWRAAYKKPLGSFQSCSHRHGVHGVGGEQDNLQRQRYTVIVIFHCYTLFLQSKIQNLKSKIQNDLALDFRMPLPFHLLRPLFRAACATVF